MTASARRVSLEPAYLLHHYPWRDSSRIFELLTRTHGRVSVFARASRKTASGAGTALQPTRPPAGHGAGSPCRPPPAVIEAG